MGGAAGYHKMQVPGPGTLWHILGNINFAIWTSFIDFAALQRIRYIGIIMDAKLATDRIGFHYTMVQLCIRSHRGGGFHFVCLN